MTLQRRRRRERLLTGLVIVVASVLGMATPVSAFWTASSTGPYGLAQASMLTAPAVSTSSLTATTAVLAWTKPFAPTGYSLAQTPGTLAGCAAAPGASLTGCSATGLTPNTSYTWNLMASSYSWTVPASIVATTPKQATTTTLSAIAPTSGSAGRTVNATATVAGNAGYGTPAGTAMFSLYKSSSCVGTASYTSAALTLSAGAVSGTLSPAAAGTYYLKAVYTPTDSYNLASTSSCSAAITVTPPGPTIGAPTTGTSSSKDLTVAYPTGVAAGDFLVLVVVNSASQDATPESGWTAISSQDLGGSSMEMQVWWRTAGTETSLTGLEMKTNSGGATAWILDFGNRPSPALRGVIDGTSTSATSLTPPTLTTTAANATVVSLVGVSNDDKKTTSRRASCR